MFCAQRRCETQQAASQRRRDGVDLGRRRYPRATLTGHQGWVNAVAIAPDGTWLATASDDDTLRIWASAR
jgi:WD40 repeat protein